MIPLRWVSLGVLGVFLGSRWGCFGVLGRSLGGPWAVLGRSLVGPVARKQGKTRVVRKMVGHSLQGPRVRFRGTGRILGVSLVCPWGGWGRFECFWGSLAGAPCCFLGKRRRKSNENAKTSVNTVFGKRPGSYEIYHFVILAGYSRYDKYIHMYT